MEQLFSSIPTALNALEPNKNIDKAVVFAAWSRCAGDQLRIRTAPLDFFDKRLVIAVQDKTWQRNLEALNPQMLFKINGSLGFGTVKFIEFCIDARAISVSQKDNAEQQQQETAKIAPSLKSAADAIADIDLRKQFLSAAAVYLAKQKPILNTDV